MKKLFFVIVMFTVSLNITAQDQEAMMKAWTEYMTPGPMHKMFEKMAGDWKTVTTFTDPASGQETKSEGTAKFEMILGGRYVKSIHNGTMMGMPFEGLGIDAYDNKLGEFISVWIDNMGTGLIQMKGKFDESTKTLSFKGTGVDPMTGKEMPYRSVTKIIDADHHLFEMYGSAPDGSEYKMFEMTYTRIK